MKSHALKKNLLLATAISTLTVAATASADYDIQDLGLAGDYWKFDMDGGTVAATEESALGTAVVLIEDGVKTVLVDNAAYKNFVGVDGDTVYFTETMQVDGEWTDNLFRHANGVTEQITSSAGDKEGFKVDDSGGNIAWFETVDGGRELFIYDGSNVSQLTTGSTPFGKGDHLGRNIHIDNGQIAWTENNTVFLYDGANVIQASDTGVVVGGYGSFDGGKAVWLQADAESGEWEVFQYEAGVVTQLTDEGPSDFSKSHPDVDDGMVSYHLRVGPSIGSGRPNHLYVLENGTPVKISESIVNYVDGDNGKLIFTEGSAWDTPSELFEYKNGTVTLVRDGFRTQGIQADGGHLIWAERSIQGNFVFQASPLSTNVNLGAEHSFTDITVNGETEVEVSQWSGWSWTPTYVEFAFKANDGLPLDGVTVVGQNGQEFELSGDFDRIPQTFDYNAQSVTIQANGRDLELQWWATTQPNPIDLGAEHSKTTIDLDRATTITASQWSGWSWNPTTIGFGFTSEDDISLTGLTVVDSDGNTHNLYDFWTAVNRPFYWQPVSVVIPAAPGRLINAEWWAAGN